MVLILVTILYYTILYYTILLQYNSAGLTHRMFQLHFPTVFSFRQQVDAHTHTVYKGLRKERKRNDAKMMMLCLMITTVFLRFSATSQENSPCIFIF